MRFAYQSLFGSSVPGSYGTDTNAIVLGTRVRFHAPGRVVGLRYYRDQANGDFQVGHVIRERHLGEVLRSTLFRQRTAGDGPSGGEWQHGYFRPWLRVADLDELLIAVTFGGGNYWRVPGGLSGAPVISDDLEAIQDGDGDDNGVYTYGAGLNLDLTYGGGFYGIDLLFLRDP